MTEAMEHLRLPDNLMNQLHITADTTPTGIVLTGQLLWFFCYNIAIIVIYY